MYETCIQLPIAMCLIHSPYHLALWNNYHHLVIMCQNQCDCNNDSKETLYTLLLSKQQGQQDYIISMSCLSQWKEDNLCSIYETCHATKCSKVIARKPMRNEVLGAYTTDYYHQICVNTKASITSGQCCNKCVQTV
jgi:hypothetical protein